MFFLRFVSNIEFLRFLASNFRKKKDFELNFFFLKTYTFTLKYNSYFVEIFVILSSHARVVKASD